MINSNESASSWIVIVNFSISLRCCDQDTNVAGFQQLSGAPFSFRPRFCHSAQMIWLSCSLCAPARLSSAAHWYSMASGRLPPTSCYQLVVDVHYKGPLNGCGFHFLNYISPSSLWYFVCCFSLVSGPAAALSSSSPVTSTFVHHITECGTTSTPVSSSGVRMASAGSRDMSPHRTLHKYVCWMVFNHL